MTEIINFLDRLKKNINDTPVIVHNIQNRKEYLMMCKEILTHEEYFDVCCGILDEDYYVTLEEALQKIIVVYFSHESI
jgi:hypothetical protein